MTSKPIELRQAILDSVCCCGDVEQATDAILDAVIAALPEDKDAYRDGSNLSYEIFGYNCALSEIKYLLNSAKELPTNKENK